MFWDNFVILCNKKGKSPNGACAELGFSKNTATKWKHGSVPYDTTLQKIADYFGVTVAYLKGIEEKEEAPTAETVEADDLNEMLEELKNRPEMRMLFSLDKGATKEDVELAVQIIERMRRNGGDGA